MSQCYVRNDRNLVSWYATAVVGLFRYISAVERQSRAHASSSLLWFPSFCFRIGFAFKR